MKLRVAHIITQLELGGAQQNTLYTLAHLNRERYEPYLLCGKKGLLDPEAQQLDIPVYFVPGLVRPIHPIKDLCALIALYRLFRTIKPHILHSHSSKAGILGRLAAYLAGVPVIIHTFHGFGFTPIQKPVVQRLLIQAEKFCGFLSAHLIFVAEENRRRAASLGIGAQKPSSLIRSGIVLEVPTASTVRDEFHILKDAWVITSVGNFKPQKNPMDLARIAVTVLERDPTIHFLFVGDGELRPAAEKWAASHTRSDKIHFLGWRRDIPEILAASNTFLLTSRWEGLPRALVEALAAQLPGVAYAVDGVLDILQDEKSGFLISPGDIGQAAEKLYWLKNHPQEAKVMGLAGHARVQNEFDIDQMVRQQEQLYEKLYEGLPLKDYYESRWTIP